VFIITIDFEWEGPALEEVEEGIGEEGEEEEEEGEEARPTGAVIFIIGGNEGVEEGEGEGGCEQGPQKVWGAMSEELDGGKCVVFFFFLINEGGFGGGGSSTTTTVEEGREGGVVCMCVGGRWPELGFPGDEGGGGGRGGCGGGGYYTGKA
jgi:hypothetical protein